MWTLVQTRRQVYVTADYEHFKMSALNIYNNYTEA